MKLKQIRMPKLKPAMERKIHAMRKLKGKFIALEPKTGRWFSGTTAIEAGLKAKAEMPDGLFYILRAGFKVAGQMK